MSQGQQEYLPGHHTTGILYSAKTTFKQFVKCDKTLGLIKTESTCDKLAFTVLFGVQITETIFVIIAFVKKNLD